MSIPLLLTFQNHQVVDHTTKSETEFAQPLLQTTMIFIGEILCILAIQLASKTPSLLDPSLLEAIQPQHAYGDHWTVPISPFSCSALWFIFPSACDLISTTLMNLGLIYSTPSVFQMVRSSIVGFSAICSFLFLTRRFLGREWTAVLTILVGTGWIVVAASKEEQNWFGPSLIVLGQLFVAGQFTLEEYLMDRFHVEPVRAMGIEGLLGTFLLGITLLVSAFVGKDWFDIRAGFEQLLDSDALWQSALALALVVAIFNFFGLAVSTKVGVPGRSAIDTTRTVLVWLLAIHYGWDAFSWLQLGGFIVLVFGTFAFNGVFASLRAAGRTGWGDHSESAPLLS
ncbi:hypothetical protein EC973_009358 [Apophysomyces ossiformis]|uniref:Integral membrane protein n=1 Tax=Apophysomyces ossiformis TaxID=679940 RepID=A0A8H7BSE3_9FUNG|nr:hypothetical protein EC973_009358 [Apophysomyces ossiformis]